MRMILILCMFCAMIAGADDRIEVIRKADWGASGALKMLQKEGAPGRAFSAKVSSDIRTPSGNPALEITVDGDEPGGTPRQIWLHATLEAAKGEAFMIRFPFKGKVSAPFTASTYRAGGDWRPLGVGGSRKFEANSEWQEAEIRIVSELEGKLYLRMPSLNLNALKKGDVLYLGEVTIGRELPVERSRNPVLLHEYRWTEATVKNIGKENASGNDFEATSQDGNLELKMLKHDGKTNTGGRQVWMNTGFQPEKGKHYRVSFQAKSSVPGKFDVTAYQAGGEWRGLGQPSRLQVELNGEWQEVIWNCVSGLDWKGTMRLPAFSFGGFPAGATIAIGKVRIEELMEFQALEATGDTVTPAGVFAAFPGSQQLYCGIPFLRREIVSVGEQAELKMAAPAGPGEALYLLHTGDALSEKQIGSVSFYAGDKKVKSVPVQLGQELDNIRSSRLLPNGVPGCRTSDGTDELRLFVSRFSLPLETFDRIVLERIPGAGRWLLYAASLTPLAANEKEARQVKFVANSEWCPMDLDDLYVKKGTALDLAGIVDRVPCGTYGRVVVNGNGRTVFEKRPETPVRFIGYSFGPSPNNISKDKKAVEAFADALAAQGYNMVRFHGINGLLMSRHKWDGKLYDDPDTIPFIEDHEDRFHYLVHCLKQRGIYIYLDLATFSSGWTTADVWGGGPQGFAYGLIAGNEQYRANYRAGVLRMLRAQNPYTGMKLADDPVFAVMLFYNEQNLRWSMSDYMGKLMQPKWIEFLKAKYGTLDKVRGAWTETPPPADATWESLPILNMPATQQATEFARDMAEFIVKVELETTDWYKSVMKEVGYRGLTTQWDFIYRLSEIPARASVPVVSQHAYHAHPSNFISVNSHVPQSSVITSGCSMFRVLAPVRMIDRPYMVAEYGQVFWNRFRHEQGLSGAYGALQEWDLLMVHSTPTVKAGTRILPFHAGSDPAIRAAEVVTAYAYLRGDVAPAKNTIVFPITDEFIFQKNRPFTAFNGNLAFLFAVSRIGARYEGDIQRNIKADLEVKPLGGAGFNDFGMYGTVTDSYRGTDVLRDELARMRELKLIGAENRTDPEKGIYQSDTGEITMHLHKGGILDVITPRLEGSTVKANEMRKLGRLTIVASSCPAAFTVIARNAEKTVATDDSLLLVINTDALNSAMTFADSTRERLIDIGTLPVLYQTGQFEVKVRNSTLVEPVVHALKLNGERGDKLPARYENGELIFKVDTAKLPVAGPTPFFEITSLGQGRK